MTNLVLGGSTPSDGFELKSLRVHGNGTHLTHRNISAGSSTTWTWSMWVKPDMFPKGGESTSNGNNLMLWSAANPEAGSGWTDFCEIQADNTTYFNLRWQISQSGAVRGKQVTTRKFRDPSAWMHFVFVWDTTNAASADRMQIWVNGVRETSFSTNTVPAQNSPSLFVNAVHDQMIGNYSYYNIAYYQNGHFPANSLFSEVHFIDGTALTAASFGETNEDTNQWQPKDPADIKTAVTYGKNGYYLPFSNDALATSFTDADYHVPHTSLTAVGTAHTDTGVKKFGTASLQCDGDSDYLRVPDHDDWNLGSGDFTIEAWVYNATASGTQRLFSHTSHAVNGKKGWNIYLTSDTSGRFTWSTDGSDEESWTFANCMTQNTWTHFALTRTGTTLTVFKNGVQVDTTTDSDMTTIWNSPRDLLIGAFEENDSTLSGYWNGYIDEVRISKVVRYSAGFTVATAAHTADKDTSLLLHMDGSNGGTTFTDSSWTGVGGKGHEVTANGDVTNERISNNKPYAENQTHIIGPKVGSSAIKFDGSGDYLSAPDHADWALGSSDFTLESWINTIAKADQVLFSQYEDSSNRWYLRLDERDGQQDIGFYDIDGGISIEASDGSWPGINQWVHMAFVRSSGVIKIYIDGSEVTLKTNTNPSASWGNYAATLRIGDYNGGNNFEGYLDEIRISNTARYTSNFTPSTTAFSSDSNTKLLIHSNTTHGSTTFDDSGATDHTITATGNIKHIAPKIGTGIGVFDGNNDYLNFNNSSTMPEFMIPGNGVRGDGGTITYETWVSFNSIPTNDTNSNTIFASTAGNLSANYSRLVYDSGLKWRWRIYNSSDSLIMGLDAADSLSVDTWYHVAFVMNGTNCKIYRDGVEKGSATMSGTPRTPDRTFHWGRYDRSSGSGNYMNGYMDESRISSSARYTSGFTPSTTAFKDDKDTLLLLHMDGGGGIDPLTNLPTLPGQGTYFWDASVDAIFYNADGTPANKSIITFDGTGDYLSVPTSTDFNPGTNFTVECWFQYGGDDEGGIIGNQNSSGYNGWFFRIVNTTDKLDWNNYGGSGGAEVQVITAGSLVWNTGQWYHLAMVKEGNDYELFRDGTSVATLTSSASLTNGGALFIGKDYASDETVCKMDQIRISNSARYTSNFTPPTTPFTSDVNTKLLIQSEFSEGGLGADHSNNYNYFTPTNLGVDDMMEDSSTNDFCTFNPLNGKSDLTAALKEGSLQVGTGVGASGFNLFSTFGVTSGKWYYEYRDNSPATRNSGVGWCDVVNADKGTTVEALIAVGAVWYNNIMYQQGSSAAIGATLDKNTIAGVALDADAGKVWFSHNGVWWDSQNPATGANPKFTAGTNPTTWTPIYHQGNQGNGTVNYGQDSSFDGAVTAQGNQDENNKGDFYYPVPSGFLALCSDNLDDPPIESPEDHFNTVAYSGNESNPTSAGAERIIDCGFQPDLTWLKIRTQDFSNRLFDSIRGSNKALYSNATAAEAAGTSGYIDRFVSNGPVLKAESDGDNRDVNVTGDTYVVWNWKAGGAPTADNSAGAGNTPTAGSVKINGSNLGSALAGTIPATRLTANTTAGFSIVKWAGSGSNATVAHGLSQAPELIINKSITGSSSTHQWAVQSLLWQSASDTNMMYLNSTGAQSDDTNVFQAAPTTTVFSPQGGGWGGIGASGETYITYCWHSVEGYSKVGTFAGNGGVDGPFIYLGFKPGWVMIKTSNLSNHQWYIWDNKRVVDNPNNKVMYPSTNLGDQTSNDYLIDFLSNGFKVRNASNFDNNSSGAYLYMAFAEEPFKTAHAR